MKTLIVLSAFPGSGKSTWCKKYVKTHPNTYIISSDEIRFEITGQYQDFSKQKEVWELFEKRIHEYALLHEDVTVILDALCDLNSLRINYVKNSPEYDKYILVWIKKDFSEVVKYNKERKEEHWVPDDILLSLYHKFEEPSEEAKSYYDEVIEIDNYF